jgi:hypothetical protein
MADQEEFKLTKGIKQLIDKAIAKRILERQCMSE